MEIQKGLGLIFWIVMFFFAAVGALTFPYGIAIWAVQVYALIRILRTPDDVNEDDDD